MSNHRIPSLAVTPDVARQTPKNEFGDVMLQTLKTGVTAGSEIIGGLVPGMPVLSAAVSGIGQALGVASTQTSGRASSVVAPSASLGAGGTGTVTGDGSTVEGGTSSVGGVQGESTAQLLQDLSTSDNKGAYIELQMRMARESEQFSALSNVLKVRSDAAKAAINNIR